MLDLGCVPDQPRGLRTAGVAVLGLRALVAEQLGLRGDEMLPLLGLLGAVMMPLPGLVGNVMMPLLGLKLWRSNRKPFSCALLMSIFLLNFLLVIMCPPSTPSKRLPSKGLATGAPSSTMRLQSAGLI